LLYYVQASSQTDNQYIPRIDHQFSSNHRLAGRYFYDGLDNPGIIDLRNRLTNIPNRRWTSQSYNLTDTYTLSAKLLTNTTLSFSRIVNIQLGQNFPGNKALGINVPIMSKGIPFAFP